MHEMVPIVGEDYEYGTPTISYFAVAVVKKNSAITVDNLKGKKSCHTGAGKTAGWNVPVGFLLSKNIMPTDESCNAYIAAGKFFYKSCVSSRFHLLSSLKLLLKGYYRVGELSAAIRLRGDSLPFN